MVADGSYFGRHFVRWVYNRAAGFWRYPDDPRLQAADRDHLLPLLQRALAGVDDPRVLDIATGTGRIPLLLVRDAPWFQGSVIGLDASPGMLDRARASLAGFRVELVEGWAEDLPWPDGTFDLVTCFEGFHNFGRPRRALAEMCRVLRPGGALLIDRISDTRARLAPLKALTRQGFQKELGRIGMEGITFAGYDRRLGRVELVLANRGRVLGVEQ